MNPEFEHIKLENKNGSLKLFQINEAYFKDDWHFHTRMELTYIIKGTGMRYVGDHSEIFKDGDLVLLGKNIPHKWDSFRNYGSSGVEAIMIQFPEEICKCYSEFQVLGPMLQKSLKGIVFRHPSMRLLQLLHQLTTKDSALQLIKFLEILVLLKEEEMDTLSSTAFNSQNLQKVESRINKVKTFIDTSIYKIIRVSEMAEYMQMSDSYFCRWFKKNLEHTPVQYINELKVELVCRELVMTDKNISEIAYDMGFENISHFNRVFRGIKNVSPREFRKNQRPGNIHRCF